MSYFTLQSWTLPRSRLRQTRKPLKILCESETSSTRFGTFSLSRTKFLALLVLAHGCFIGQIKGMDPLSVCPSITLPVSVSVSLLQDFKTTTVWLSQQETPYVNIHRTSNVNNHRTVNVNNHPICASGELNLPVYVTTEHFWELLM